jgi:hypothetical protein
MEYFHTHGHVQSLLTQYPLLRDSDSALLAYVWARALKAMNRDLDHLDARGLLSIIAAGKMPAMESVTRSRRKLQEENPELRGQRYDQRQRQTTKVKEELGYGKRLS